MAVVKPHHRLWLTTTAIIMFGWITIGISGQVNNRNTDKATPIQDAPRTKFSCQGRASGYYADVDTGCQVYHMCDGLGRQFSYACPNTTLFQQRMLVCDHWYMVNCSRAESNYGANLLIGQKDKPFVPEEENEIRTPRPDLLDRPYAPDYSGESFRKSFKNNLPAALNSIAERGKSASKKTFSPELLEESASVHGAAIHWGTKYSQKDGLINTTPIPASSELSKVVKLNGRREIKDEVAAVQISSRSSNGASANLKNVELKFPSNNGNQRSNANSSPVSTVAPIGKSKTSLKTPSKVYEPPFTQPDYTKFKYNAFNEKSTLKPSTNAAKTTTTKRTTVTTSPRPTQRSQTSTYRTSQRVVTTQNPTTTARSTPTTRTTLRTTTTAPTTSFAALGKALVTQNSFKAFENFLNSNKKTTHKDYDFSKYFTNPTSTTVAPPRSGAKILHKPIVVATPIQRPAQIINQNTPTFLREPLIVPPYRGQPTTTRQPSTTEPFLQRQPLISGPDRPINISEPSNDLLPPFTVHKEYDDSSTQGPPIYYEWKWSVPAFILEAPVAAVGDSEKSSSQRSTNIHGRNGLSKTLADDIPSAPEKTDNHSATTRSVSRDTANDDLDSSKIIFKKIAQYDFNNLQKQFLIPQFEFPLETVDDRAADRYDDINKVTSFQVKIPKDVQVSNAKPWYGENDRCPECHPSFLMPGTCEPCVKIRR